MRCSTLFVGFLAGFAVCQLAVAQNSDSLTSNDSAQPYKLRATFSEHGNKLLPETPYHLQAEQASNFYANGNLPDAERRYREALRLAELDPKLDPETHAKLLTNLAAVLRDENKGTESEKLFGQAIQIARLHLSKRQGILDYIAHHYCSLLRKEGRNFEATIVAQNAKLGFPLTAQQPRMSANIDQIDLNADLGNTLEKKPAVIKSDQQEHPPETVQYTISIKSDGPGCPFDDWSHNKTHEPPRVSGTFDFYIDSKYNPVHLQLKIPPDTYLWPTTAMFMETYTCPSWRKPVVYSDHIGVPCDFEPMTFSKSYQFHDVQGYDWYHCSQPSDAPPYPSPFYHGTSGGARQCPGRPQ